jgi:two-component system phosphate regulon sensor histidine kinase PhoR
MFHSSRFAFISALVPAFLSTLVVILITGDNSRWLWALIVFVIVFTFTFLVDKLVLQKYYFNRLRDLYDTILNRISNAGGNSIARKIPDVQLQKEIMRMVHDLENSDKEEIVHLKELELYRKEFLGNVSHELKTPIFTIQGYVHTLLDGGIEDQDINQLYLQKASRSIDRLISIVDDLESISRMEAGGLILENRTFDCNELIRDVIESLELRAKEASITLSSVNPAGEQYYVYADKERIRQVLVNLLVNSIKYGKKDGHTSVKIEDQDDYITVDVEDNGIGVERHHLSRLFERFYRVDKSRSREQGGTGLGLAIVKHIIEAHQQKITVESSPGAGTRFTFTLKKSQ